METKTTSELIHEIKAATDIEDFLAKNKSQMLTQSLPEYLHKLRERRGLSRPDVVRGSMLDRVYVYQIFSGEREPSRDKLLAIAFGMGLSVNETQKLMKLSGNRELYPRDERDALLLFVLKQGGTVLAANELLHEHGLAVLGGAV